MSLCSKRRCGLGLLVCVTALLGALPVGAATYYVNSISALTTRINAAVAGDEIVMSNGVYTTSASLGINRVGTAANPILIRAETIGAVEIAGTHGFSLNSGATYITIQGFKFTHAAAISISSGASHCRLTRNVIQLAIPAGTDVSYINISGDDIEIDRNELRNKSTLGSMLDITGSGSQVARRLWVHHNYFHDFVSPGGNGAETIRWGLSGLSLSTGNGLCEYNLFTRCDGENEMISNKSSGNTYRYNTVIDSPGDEISQRHGNDCLYYGNYMRNTQGMRIYGDRHKIFSNYFESNNIAVNMGNGDGDVYNGALLTAHDRPDDNVVVFNTFVSNSTHYQMGGRTGGLGSSNTVVANNIFQGGGSMGSISSSAPYTGSWSNNIRWQTSSAGSMPASAYTTVNPLLVKDSTGAFHLQAGSPAINAGVGASNYYGVYSSFAYVTNDMDGQTRDGSKDIGADEVSGTPVLAKILTTNDVGPLSGLLNQAAAPTFSPGNGTYSLVPISVTITSATSGASIRYTTNGATPGSATGTLYSSPVIISGNTSLRAVAYKAGMSDSLISIANYTIGGSVSFEAEDLAVTGLGASTAPQTDALTSGGLWIALLADGAGDYVEYILPNIPTGIYQLNLAYKAHPNRGILSFAVNGKISGTSLDQYANPPTYPEVSYGPITFFTTGNQIVRQTVLGRNPSAGAFTLSADKFTLVPVGPLQSPDIASAVLVEGDLLIAGTNGIPGTICYVLSSTNLTAPMNNWVRVATNLVGPGGELNFAHAVADDRAAEFFRFQLGP
jgi:hypothetical protein